MKRLLIIIVVLLVGSAAAHAGASADPRLGQLPWLGLRLKADSLVNFFQDRLLLVDPQSERGAALFHDYFDCVRVALSLPYDLNDLREEATWNKYLAYMMTYFYVCCDSMPGRTAEAYDNLLARKNFFALHSGKGTGLATSWQQVAQRLAPHEAAIELNDMKQEFLVVKHGYNEPHGIEVDSLLRDEITQDLADEPLAIDRLYARGGPLGRLWALLAPELRDVTTLYISGNFMFSQINFGAIPVGGGSTLADKYEVHQVLSTASVGTASSKPGKISSAVLFGGIDYESGQTDSVATAVTNEPWNTLRGVPRDLRNGFGPLPNSRAEVMAVDSVLTSSHIPTQVFLGSRATEQAVRQLDGHAPSLLHFSTHGFMLAPLYTDSATLALDPSETRYLSALSQSGLLLAGANVTWRGQRHNLRGCDGILTSSELMKMDLSRCRLALLSACRGALGENINLTGMPFGVAYALKMAGVGQILCSLWSVDDAVTSVYMKHFYRYLARVGDPAAALKLTVAHMKRDGYTSPYYWASFILVE